MKRANLKHRPLVVDILSNAFRENKSINYVIKRDDNRGIRIRKLIEYSFNVCNLFGDVWLSEDKKACALILYPDKKRTLSRMLIWDINLAISVIGLSRVLDVMKRESMIKSFHPKKPYAYLWFIGVTPEYQSKGVGSTLLKEVVEECERNNRPVYLETSVDRNIPWYEKFGFEIYQQLQLSYTLYLMRRTPGN